MPPVAPQAMSEGSLVFIFFKHTQPRANSGGKQHVPHLDALSGHAKQVEGRLGDEDHCYCSNQHHLVHFKIEREGHIKMSLHGN